MVRPRLVVHLGAEGAGTTTLARYLGVNRRALHASGVYFHPVIRPVHRLLDFEGPPTLAQLRRARSGRAQDLAADLLNFATLREIETVGSEITILSSPDLLFFSADDVRAFRRRFTDFDLEPIFVTRPFADVADTRFSTLVLEYAWTDEPSVGLVDDDLLPRLEMWADAATTGQLTVLDYAASPDDVIGAFLQAAGVPDAGLSPRSVMARQRVSAPPMFVALARAFRQQGVAEEHLRGLVGQLEKFAAAERQTNLPGFLRQALGRAYDDFRSALREASAFRPAPGWDAVPAVNAGDPLHIANLSDAVFALGRAAAAAGRSAPEEQVPSRAQLWRRIQVLEQELERVGRGSTPPARDEREPAATPRSVDFVIVGAQKAGTTALWKFLGRHPAVFLPRSKETRFFQFDAYYERGREWFEQEYFSIVDDRVCGMATPHVMGGTPDAAPGEIARRLAAYRPDLKLVALLRDPVERAVSHHRMMVRRGHEERRFGQAVHELLARDRLEDSRRRPSETNSYVIRGEYGRILGEIGAHFPSDQLLVLWTEDLAARPVEVTRQVCEFVGVAPEDLPEVGGTIFAGGGTPRVDAEAAGELRSFLDARVWPHVSSARAEEFEFFFELWNTVPDSRAPDIDEATRDALSAHFTGDARTLLDEFNLEAPWLRRWAVRT